MNLCYKERPQTLLVALSYFFFSPALLRCFIAGLTGKIFSFVFSEPGLDDIRLPKCEKEPGLPLFYTLPDILCVDPLPTCTQHLSEDSLTCWVASVHSRAPQRCRLNVKDSGVLISSPDQPRSSLCIPWSSIIAWRKKNDKSITIYVVGLRLPRTPFDTELMEASGKGHNQASDGFANDARLKTCCLSFLFDDPIRLEVAVSAMQQFSWCERNYSGKYERKLHDCIKTSV